MAKMIEVRCPTCDAKPGEHCKDVPRMPRNGAMFAQYHIERNKAAKQ